MITQCFKQAELKLAQAGVPCTVRGEPPQRIGIAGKQLWLGILTLQQPHQQLVEIQAGEQAFRLQLGRSAGGFHSHKLFHVSAARKTKQQGPKRLQKGSLGTPPAAPTGALTHKVKAPILSGEHVQQEAAVPVGTAVQQVGRLKSHTHE